VRLSKCVGLLIMFTKPLMKIISLICDLLECMWFELKTKFQSILININYRSVRQAPAYYWQYFDFMLKRALDENCNIICFKKIICSFIIPNFTFIIFIITETTTYCDICSIMIAKLSVNVYCVTINNTYRVGDQNRKIWDYKRADYLLMKQKISEIDWVNLITSACDIHGAVSDFTSKSMCIVSLSIILFESVIK
jgi:hypothetical protein